MVYNVKRIEYPNGSMQLRVYDKPMSCKAPTDYYEDDEIYNPFEPAKVFHSRDLVDDFKDTPQATEESKEENKRRNYNRTKQVVYSYARCCNWEWFITLTFKPDKVNRYDFDECSKKVRKWLNNQRRNAPNLQYLVVPEQHKDGAWHFHGVLANTGTMKFIDSGHKDKGEIIYNMVQYQYGFTTATKVKSIEKVSNYISKYMTKDLCDLTEHKHRFFASNNLPVPKVSTWYVTEDTNDFLELLCNGMGKKVAHVSHTHAKECYTQVTYIELA